MLDLTFLFLRQLPLSPMTGVCLFYKQGDKGWPQSGCHAMAVGMCSRQDLRAERALGIIKSKPPCFGQLRLDGGEDQLSSIVLSFTC